MAEILTASLLFTAGALLGVNAFFVIAHLIGRGDVARAVARKLVRYTWPLRLGDSDSSQRRKHA